MGSLSGIATLRREGDVEVLNADSHKVVTSSFSVGPLQLEVSKTLSETILLTNGRTFITWEQFSLTNATLFFHGNNIRSQMAALLFYRNNFAHNWPHFYSMGTIFAHKCHTFSLIEPCPSQIPHIYSTVWAALTSIWHSSF